MPESSPEKKENSGKEILLAIDVSPSMAGWGGLEEARNLALSLIDEEESKLGLLVFGQDTLGEWKPGTDKNELSDVVGSLSHDWKKGNAQTLLDRAPGLFSPSATEKKLVILSDFQQSDWQTAFRDLSEIGVEVDLRRVGSEQVQRRRSGNLSVVEARAVPAGPGKVRVWTVIRNWDDEAKTVPLALKAGGEIRQRQEVSLTPLGSAQAQFVLKADDFSGASVELESNDSFSLDDKRALWLKSPPARRFGFWMPEAENPETQEERDFLKTAVASAGDSGWNRWNWAQDQADGLRLDAEKSGLELLLVIGLGDWFEEQELGAALRDFVEGGGTAILTPGQPFAKTASVIRDADLFSFKFLRVAGGAVRLGNPFRIKALEESSLLNEVFDGKAARDLYLSAIHRFGIIQKVGPGVEVPIRDREGRPLALVRNFDAGGRLVFLPFRMNTSWTDLPLRNSFLPLLMELSFGGRKTMPSRAWPVLEPGDSWGEGDRVFKAFEPGVFRFEDQWLEVVPSLAESIPEVLDSDELLQSVGGRFSSSPASSLAEGSGKEDGNLCGCGLQSSPQVC